jgi:DNA-binding LacI/PurR family transcriptional regulator
MIRCIKCNEYSGISKSGIVRGKQRYYCKNCILHFTFKKADDVQETKKQAVTIKDVAKVLGISTSTISRALNDSNEIHSATKKIILEKINELGYQPNLIAKSLASHHTYTIGIIVPELIGNYYINLINGATEVLNKEGYKVFIMQSNESYHNEVSYTHALISSRVEGIIAASTYKTKDYSHFEVAKKNNIPVVFFSRINDKVKAPKINVDDYKGAVCAVEHLIEKGYKKIGYMGYSPDFYIGQLRYQGYLDTMKNHHLKINKKWVVLTDDIIAESSKYIYGILNQKNKPDAIFAMNDHIGIHIIQKANALKVKIPGELGVIGFSDDVISSYISPSLSTMRQPSIEIGMEAAKKLLFLLKNKNNKSFDDNSLTIFNAELVARSSTIKP